MRPNFIFHLAMAEEEEKESFETKREKGFK